MYVYVSFYNVRIRPQCNEENMVDIMERWTQCNVSVLNC